MTCITLFTSSNRVLFQLSISMCSYTLQWFQNLLGGLVFCVSCDGWCSLVTAASLACAGTGTGRQHVEKTRSSYVLDAGCRRRLQDEAGRGGDKAGDKSSLPSC